MQFRDSGRQLILASDVAHKTDKLAVYGAELLPDYIQLLTLNSYGGLRSFSETADIIEQHYYELIEMGNSNNIINLYDSTGMGASMGEFLQFRNLNSQGIWLHGTEGSQGIGKNGEYTMSRTDLIKRLADVLACKQIRFPDDPKYLPEKNAWKAELNDLSLKSRAESTTRGKYTIVAPHGDDRVIVTGFIAWWWRMFVNIGGGVTGGNGDLVSGARAAARGIRTR